MSRTTYLSAALLFALTTQAAMAQTPPSPKQPHSAKEILAVLGTDSHYVVTYSDKDGKPITVQQFDAALKHKAKYWANAHSDLHTVTMTLQDPVVFAKRIKTGGPLPSFHLKLVNGQPFDNASLLGHTTLVSFFFTTCAPCIAEAPTLNAYARLHPKQHVLAVTFDEASDVKTFVTENKITWPVLTDAKALIDGIGIKGYPMLALVDAQGRLQKVALPGPGGVWRKNDKNLTVAAIDHWVRTP